MQREISAGADFRDVPKNWFETAEAMVPMAKTSLSLRLDREIVDWFKGRGPGYQTRMNAVLLAFVRAKRKAGE